MGGALKAWGLLVRDFLDRCQVFSCEYEGTSRDLIVVQISLLLILSRTPHDEDNRIF